VSYESSEDLHDSKLIERLTPFNGMKHEDYISWFRRHRRKKILLPVYKNYCDNATNNLKDKWVTVRHRLLQAVQSCGVRWSLR
jgi:poly-gamma-glutamate synthesis protein (capsule biosynthesis protein)